MKKALLYFSLAAGLIATAAPDVQADTCYSCSPPPQSSCFLCNPPPNPWMIRERFVNIDPSNSDQGGVDIDHYSMIELDASYFFSRNISAEFSLTAEDPSSSARGSGASLGNVWIIPATLTLQYHFLFPNNPFQPYLGLGINYSYFSTSSNCINYDSSIGPVYQIGTDFQLSRNWFLNLDIKKVYMRPDVSVNGGPKVTDDIYPWIFGAGVGYKF